MTLAATDCSPSSDRKRLPPAASSVIATGSDGGWSHPVASAMPPTAGPGAVKGDAAIVKPAEPPPAAAPSCGSGSGGGASSGPGAQGPGAGIQHFHPANNGNRMLI